MAFYGYEPGRYVKDTSYIKDIGSSIGDLVKSIPDILKEDEKYQTQKQQYADMDEANNDAYGDLRQAAESFGLESDIIAPPAKRQDVDDYAKKSIASLLTAAKGAGVDGQTMVEKLSQLRGAGQVPGVDAAQQEVAQQQQQQQGVNARVEQFGQQQQPPEQIAQQDIQNITGGQQPSIMDGLSRQPGAEAGGAALQIPGMGQGNGIQQPESLQNIMQRLQVQRPQEFDDNPERRQEAMNAGMGGPELDQLLSDLKSGNIGLADFDDKIAKTQTAQAKKMAAARKLEDEKTEDARRRLQQNIGKRPIYLDGNQVSKIDPNRDPRDYEIGTHDFAPKERVTRYERGSGYGNDALKESAKTLRTLYGERTKMQTQINSLRAKSELDPRVLEMEGLNKVNINKEISNMLQMVDGINTDINQLKKQKPMKPTKAREMSDDEIIQKLKAVGKDQAYIDRALMAIRGKKIRKFEKGMQ